MTARSNRCRGSSASPSCGITEPPSRPAVGCLPRAADCDPVHPERRLTDADRYALPVLAAGADPVIKPPNDQYGYPTASQHAAELQFLFNLGTTLNPGEQRLAAEMKNYWANFVTSGNPNTGAAVPSWPAFASQPNVQSLVPGSGLSAPTAKFSAEHFCSVWEPIIALE